MVQFLRMLFNKPERKRVSAYVFQTVKIEERKQILFYVRGERYSIYAKCPDCGRMFGEVEILKQFRSNPNKFGIYFKCTSCTCNFIKPKMKVEDVEFEYLSPYVSSVSLTDDMLDLCPDAIKKSYPSIYYSAVFNFGRLSNAFSKIRKRKYRKVEIRDWKQRIAKLPKKYSNLDVSQIFGVPEKEIEKIRS